jgi:CheY-like chemotaxis protein
MGNAVYGDMADQHTGMPVILIVDDDPRILELAEHAARETRLFDFIATAANGRDALLKILGGERMPDVILTDLSMPQMDGFELVQTLKELAVTRHIPVAMFSSSGLLYDQQHAVEAGCAAFFPKPASLSGLREVFENVARITAQVGTV